MIKYVFFDFNGTILDDVSLCLDLLNQILIKQGKDKITLTKYKKIFTFPIKKYYELAGIDFNKDGFEDLSKWFIKEYQPKSFKCSCYPNLQETLKKLNEKGIICGVLSASEIKNLTEQLEELNLKDDFAFILGLNDIYARSKVEVARKFINDKNMVWKYENLRNVARPIVWFRNDKESFYNLDWDQDFYDFLRKNFGSKRYILQGEIDRLYGLNKGWNAYNPGRWGFNRQAKILEDLRPEDISKPNKLIIGFVGKNSPDPEDYERFVSAPYYYWDEDTRKVYMDFFDFDGEKHYENRGTHLHYLTSDDTLHMAREKYVSDY